LTLNFIIPFLFFYLTEINAIFPGHSHNDYQQEVPLYHALSLGYTSLEIDVRPYKNALAIKHNPFGLRNKPTLESLYLIPLKKIINENEGSVFKDNNATLTLLIDIKSKKKKAIRNLRSLYKKYDSLFHQRVNGKIKKGPVKLVLTGKIPINYLTDVDLQYLGIEADFYKSYPEKLIPHIEGYSCSFKKLKRKSKSSLENNINSLVKNSTSKNKTSRFWKAPDDKEVWKMLLDLNVNRISVDDLSGFHKYHSKYSSTNR